MARYDEDSGFAGAFPGGAFNANADAMSAPGSAGTDASDTLGGEVGRPVVSQVYISSQGPQLRVPVLQGDTSGSADDDPYQNGREPATGVDLDYGGAGMFQPGSGKVVSTRHPDAGR